MRNLCIGQRVADELSFSAYPMSLYVELSDVLVSNGVELSDGLVSNGGRVLGGHGGEKQEARVNIHGHHKYK